MAANTSRTLLASAARTASVDTADQRNAYHRGVRIHIDATALAATPSVVFTVQGKDSITGDYYTLLASAAITATGDTYLLVYPGATAAANTVANLALPPVWRVSVVAGDADSLTYAVTAELLI
jgi:hypothetical protein